MNRTNATYHLTAIAKCTSFIAFVFACTMAAQSTDLIIFSYNRPLQLHALLESINLHMIGLNEIFVVGRADDADYRTAYDQVAHNFPTVIFRWQGKDPRADFKPLTLECLHATDCPYVMFAVDDDVVKDTVDCSDCIFWLEETRAYGFYLRLGLNLRCCYVCKDAFQDLPPSLRQISSDVFAWSFKDGPYDWGCPHVLDMTIYRRKDILPIFESRNYASPNKIDGVFSAAADKSKTGLCYTISKMVNLPLNLVQRDFLAARHMRRYSPQDFLDIFNAGGRLDIAALYRFINPSAHTEWEPQFVYDQPTVEA